MPQETKYKEEYPGVLGESQREQEAVVSKATDLQRHLSGIPRESSKHPVGKQAAGPDIHDAPFETRQEGTDRDNRESEIGKKEMSDEREEKMKEVRKTDLKKDGKVIYENKKEVGNVEDEKKEDREVMKTQVKQGRTEDEKKKEVEKTQGKQVDVRNEKKNGGKCQNGAKDVKNVQNKENERFSQKENKEEEKKSGQVKIGNKEGESKDKDEEGVRNIMNVLFFAVVLVVVLAFASF